MNTRRTLVDRTRRDPRRSRILAPLGAAAPHGRRRRVPAEHLAEEHGHLTARQGGHVAAEPGARLLTLTQFAPRYGADQVFADEGEFEFDGEIVLASDLDPVPVPLRS